MLPQKNMQIVLVRNLGIQLLCQRRDSLKNKFRWMEGPSDDFAGMVIKRERKYSYSSAVLVISIITCS